MTTFLEQIILRKQQEVEQLAAHAMRNQAQISDLRELPPCKGFARAIEADSQFSVIAEFKRASPSLGAIDANADPKRISMLYEKAGAVAISVLTDRTFFQGSVQDMQTVRRAVEVPILCKDFIIHELQIDEARRYGADAILLIARVLQAHRLRQLANYAKNLGLDVLIEVHNETELDAALAAEPSVLGINNRDLDTFAVSLAVTEKLSRLVPSEILKIAESGVHSAADIQRLSACGVSGVLVGESLMRAQSSGNLPEMMRALQQTGKGA